MKVSINAVRAFNERFNCAPDPAPEGADKLVERIGAQLAAVEETISFGAKFGGIVIVKVVQCWKHGNSDHLNVCLIDDGGRNQEVARNNDGLVQVVCGAQNVREGLSVAWLPPGATVPSSSDSDPFVLTVREIRGEVSNGMLASAKEMALGDSHEGILEIDGDVEPGTLFTDKYNLGGDVVIDMENKMFTHRPDCFGTLGVAREIAGVQGQKFTSPDWYQANVTIPVAGDRKLAVEVRNDIPNLVPRFVAVPMSGISIKPSPVWLQVELSRLGMRPINNLVDLTNYYMLLTGQPLHAYDYDKVVAQDPGATSATIVVRKAPEGEKLTLLNGKEIEPRAEAIMIATATKAIGLAGVMGGSDTEVDESTSDIILECASFNMYSIRRTSMSHGIFSDAVARFNKGQSPLQNMAVAARIVQEIIDICGGQVAGNVVDDNHISTEVLERASMYAPLIVSAAFINDRLGLQLPATDIVELLINVEFQAHQTSTSDEISVTAPFWRTDIEIPEDVVEEVGRLYGFDKLPLELPHRNITPATKNPTLLQKSHIRNVLSQSGANELLNYSFVDGKLLDTVGQNKDIAFKLSNALSPELQYYRMSLTPGMLDKVHANIKAGYDEFVLFELGKLHATTEYGDDELPKSFDNLAVVIAAEDKKVERDYSGAAFYQARKYLVAVLADFDASATLLPIGDVEKAEIEAQALLSQLMAPFDTVRSAVIKVSDRIVGVVGEYKPSIRKTLKLPVYSAGFEMDISDLQLRGGSQYVRRSRFPGITQDICLRVPIAVSYQQLHDFTWQNLQQGQPEGTEIHLAPYDIYQRPDDSEFKQVTFRFSISSHERTMTDAEVNSLLDTVASAAAEAFHAERV